ncbi:MAG TPA: calcium/proton exchanger [Nitrososphaeraceae archaeon]|nr:calcium/proton exchanger [Nitrososphaeraceae archaeon]
MDIENIKLSKSSTLYFLLIFVPLAVILELVHADHIVLFVAAALGLIPLAKLIGDSTERLAAYYGSTLGSLLNVTFGNAAEIIIGVVSINAGLLDLVKASITGAILGNILLIFGLSIIAGGLKYKEQSFNKQNTGVQSSMLFLAVIGLAVPTVLAATTLKPVDMNNQIKIQFLSDSVAFLLLAVYIAGIIFTVFTHKHLFFAQPPVEVETEMEGQKRLSLGRKGTDGEGQAEGEWNHERWGKKKSFVLLGITMAGVVIVSEILVGSVEATTKEFGFGELFVGAIIIGIIGNAAEHTSAIILARKGKIDLSIGIAAGSGTQIALFVVPILVIAGIIMGKPVTLVFTIFEVASIFLAAIILNLIARDGKSNWFEGLMLTVVYIIIAIGFFFIS